MRIVCYTYLIPILLFKEPSNLNKSNKSFNSSLSSLSINSLNNTNDDEENLLADCISSAMPKSKSEHSNLAGKAKKTRKSPRREKSGSSERELKRATSKSPRNSRIIPGNSCSRGVYPT